MSYIEKPEHLGHILRNIRYSLNFTRAKMADALGVTERTIQNYETGNSKLTIENWVRCITILERQVDKIDSIIDKKQLSVEVADIVGRLFKETA